MSASLTLFDLRAHRQRRRAAPPQALSNAFFVDSQANPGGAGTEASPFNTIGAALAVAQPGAVIRVRAPEAAPQRERIAPDVDVRITAWDYDAGSGDTTFHIRASEEVTGGWTSLGGGIYSRSWGSGQLRTVVVMSITNVRGTPTVLDRETGTTSPSEGAFSYSGGTLYVHLPGAANPNSHTVEVDTATTGDGSHDATILVEGVTVQLDGVIALVGRNAAIRADAEGVILARDCDAGLSVTGWNTGATGRVDLTRCRGYGARNDG
ncbi:MAG: hypothetical protein AAGN64_11340, partial [Bacteroidota bacterium]